MSERSLAPKQVKLLAGLMSGRTVAQAAKGAGMSERQAYRIFKSEGFRERLAEEETMVLDAVRLKLMTLTDKALMVLEDVMDRPEAKGQNFARLAAVNVIELLLKVREHGDFEARIVELEALAGGER